MYQDKSKNKFTLHNWKMQIQTQKTYPKKQNQMKQYKNLPNQTMNQQSFSLDQSQLYDENRLKYIAQRITEQNKQIKKSNQKIQQSHRVINSIQKALILQRQEQKQSLAQRISLLISLQQNMKSDIQSQAATDRVTLQQMQQREQCERQHKQLKQNLEQIYNEKQRLIQNLKMDYQIKRIIQQLDQDLEIKIQNQYKKNQQQDRTRIQLKKQIQKLQKKNKQLQKYKKQLSYKLQVLHGNIRVYIRLRPPKNSDEQKIKYNVMENMIVIKQKNTKDNYGLISKQKNDEQQKSYVFDRIFQEGVRQNQLYDNLRDTIQLTLDGRNVCIFAYGQTGSGKTYTMVGPLDQFLKNYIDVDKIYNQMGVIPRALQQIFNEVQKKEKNGFEALIQVSIFEIYNNCYNDLLDGRKQKQLKDLAFLTIKNFNQGMLAFQKAINVRSTAPTKKNQHSSRSHLIFQIKNQFENMNPKNKNGKEQIRTSSLVMIDLAGSERLQQSQASGERFKQMTQINKSLTQLGKVFRSIKEGKQQPSFRSSKLNVVLQPFLSGGNGIGLMLINLSPQQKDYGPTKNSLIFAKELRQIKINNKKYMEQKSRSNSKDSKSSQKSSKSSKLNRQTSNNYNNQAFNKYPRK